jgi:predicted HTH domain antitoxin
MTLEISDTILQKSQMTEREILLELAIILFDKNQITLNQAKDLANMELESFEEILIQRQIFTPKSSNKWRPISLNVGKFPKDLAPYAIQKEQLEALRELFENEPSAEELCKML